ncbi:AI-2E family transporter [bacterium]|nr:AI-2E family transporter [bacterium]
MALPVSLQLRYWGVAAVALGLVLWFLGDTLLPFILGGAIAYLLDPIADRMERWGLSRLLATSVITLAAVFVFVVAMLLIVPLLVQQAISLFNTAPQIAADLWTFLTTRFPDLLDNNSTIRQSLTGLGETIQARGGALVNGLASSLNSIVNIVVLIVVVPVVAFYLLLDWDNLVAKIDELIPRDHLENVRRLGREFYMKDGYNFDLTKEDAMHAYNRHLVSYLRTYERMGLQAIPMRADSGPIGGDDTHEFLVLAETGESEVFYDSAVTDLTFGDRDINYDDKAQCQSIMEEFTTKYARTDETHDEALFAEVPQERRKVARGIEVGQIFYFGTKYSEAMGATVQDGDGKQVPVHMGSHGIGVSRLVGAIIEASHDDKGIIWPEGVTPFHCGIVNLKQGDAEADAACEDLYHQLTKAGLEPLYDDRNERAGGKFATMDLIGLPWRLTVGPRGLKNGVVELTCRKTGESEELTPQAAIAKVIAQYN